MKFYTYPKQQKYHLVYSKPELSKTSFFKSLLIQLSPRKLFLEKLLLSNVGSRLRFASITEIAVPHPDMEYIGIVKNGIAILFEMVSKIPEKVWRLNENGVWGSEVFFGYPVIAEYSAIHFEKRYSLIEKALKAQWQKLYLNKERSHGDFTHFNILIGTNDEIHLIDEKELNVSLLFDFFYFYSYLKQCLNRTDRMSLNQKQKVILSLEVLIQSICVFSIETELTEELSRLSIPLGTGLQSEKLAMYLSEFKRVLVS